MLILEGFEDRDNVGAEQKFDNSDACPSTSVRATTGNFSARPGYSLDSGWGSTYLHTGFAIWFNDDVFFAGFRLVLTLTHIYQNSKGFKNYSDLLVNFRYPPSFSNAQTVEIDIYGHEARYITPYSYLKPKKWNHIQISASIGSAAVGKGIFNSSVYVNGKLIYTLPSSTVTFANLNPAYYTPVSVAISKFRFESNAANLDDLYITDSPTIKGILRVYSLKPIEDITSQWLVEGATSHYEAVNESQSNGDIDYIYTTETDVIDEFLFEPISLDPNDLILGYQYTTHVKKDQAVEMAYTLKDNKAGDLITIYPGHLDYRAHRVGVDSPLTLAEANNLKLKIERIR